MAAAKKGEAFDIERGRPVSSLRAEAKTATWFDFTCKYVDMKWPDLAATARPTVAEALLRVVPVFVPKEKHAPTPKEIRSALRQWCYNPQLRTSDDVPDEVRAILEWCSRNTLAVVSVLEPGLRGGGRVARHQPCEWLDMDCNSQGQAKGGQAGRAESHSGTNSAVRGP
jgi:hypothetical protein